MKKLLVFLAFLLPLGSQAKPYGTYEACKDFVMFTYNVIDGFYDDSIPIKKGEMLTRCYNCGEHYKCTWFYSEEYGAQFTMKSEFQYHIDNGDMIPWEE